MEKSANLGMLVRVWREANNLRTGELATLVRGAAKTEAGKAVKRQHIEQLERAGNRAPRYLPDLAAAMRTTSDDLVALKMPPMRVGSIYPKKERGPDALEVVSVSDAELLDAVRNQLAPEEIDAILRRHRLFLEKVQAAVDEARASMPKPEVKTDRKPSSFTKNVEINPVTNKKRGSNDRTGS